MKKIYVIILTAIIGTNLLACGADAVVDDITDQVSNVVQADNENVLAVKNGTNNNYPNVTYEEAFDSFFGSPTWKYFEGTKEGPDENEDGEPDYTEEHIDIVEFTGMCTYMDVEVKALIQFTLDKEGGSFEASYLSFNEVPQSTLIMAGLIQKAFETYMENNGMLEETTEVSEDTETIEEQENEDTQVEEEEAISDSTQERLPDDVSNEDEITYFEEEGLRSTTTEYAYWEENREMNVSLTYLGETKSGNFVGDFYARMAEYNEESDETEEIIAYGTFVEGSDEHGIITLENGNICEYSLWWEDDHYEMNLLLDDVEMTLLEADWAYANVG